MAAPNELIGIERAAAFCRFADNVGP